MSYGKRNYILHSIFLLATTLLVGSCNVTRNIPEGDFLLDKNIIKTDRPEYKENISSIIKQKPNKKILGIFRFHLGVYNLGSKGKETKFKKWLKTAVGEQPVILDTSLTNKSTRQITIFMQNNGYFNATVNDTTYYRRKKSKVEYKINSGKPYRIRNVYYKIPDTTLQKIILDDTSASLITRGKIYSNTVLQKERERINSKLRNLGYYHFNPLYITYKIDTTIGDKKLDVWLYLSNPKINSSDSVSNRDTILYHDINFIQEVIVEMDYDPIKAETNVVKDTSYFKGLNFIMKGKVENVYTPKHFTEHIFIRKDSTFAQDDIDLTYRRLSDLGIFRFVNIRIEALEGKDTLNRSPLRCYILLAPQKKQEYTLEVEGTNSGGNFGIAGNIVYKNKNIFKGAETFTFKLKGGLEIQQNFGDTTYQSTRQLALFNAYEIGPEISLNFPRALWPFNIRKQKRVNNPTTTITAGFNTQNRPEYFRRLANVSYFFTKKTTKYNRLYFYPAEINYLNNKLDPAFEKQLQELSDLNIILGYVDQFIANGRVSYLFNNQELNVRKKYLFFRVNFEFAGNSLYLAKRLNGENPDPDIPSEILGVRFAQYIRPDFDLRFYKPIVLSNSLLVLRLMSGLGVPYGNSKQLPFEKSFYAGGPNDIRAWRTRQIGPGSNQKTDFYERFGDIKITTNIEYRFDIFRKLKGAAFIDAGNIWLLKSYSSNPKSEFHLNTFVDEIAIGTGLGIRFDFTFFIIRMDGAIQVQDPSKDFGERWVLGNNKLRDITFNFGIGYPF